MLEKVLVSINKTLRVELCDASKYLKTLPKLQDMTDLQAKADCLLRENGELKTQLATQEVELAKARKKTNKAVEVA